MARQLNLDRDKLDQCYEIAGQTIAHAWKYIQRHASFGIERATLLHLGIHGEYRGESLASRLVASLTKDQLRLGSAYWWGRALAADPGDPKDVVMQLIRQKLTWEDLPKADPRQIKQLTKGTPPRPVTAAAGNSGFGLHLKDAKPKRLRNQAHDWLKKQAGMALLELDTSNRFRDFWSEEEYQQAWSLSEPHRGIPAVGGLKSPEQTLWAGANNFSTLQTGGLNEILHKEIDPHRGLVDLGFVLTYCAQNGLKVLGPHITGRPTFVLTHLLLFEQLAQRAGMLFENVILLVSLNPDTKNFLEQVAWLQLLREIFSQSQLWMKLLEPPHPLDLWAAGFAEIDNLLFTKEPEVQTARGEWQKISGAAQEFQLNTHGVVARQAQHLLDQTWRQLKRVQTMQLWEFLEGGEAGRDGVFQKSYHYWNPLWQV